MKSPHSVRFLVGLATALITPVVASAHCDTMDGPVVKAAQVALERADITPVLKWVRLEDEPEIREAFAKTLTVRAKGADARELSDRYFFETLVRVHRAGEGAPYEGLKPSGTDLGPAVAGADVALESGSVDALVKLVTGDVAGGILKRFERASTLRKHADDSVEGGREFVEAYVQFVHYVERLHLDATSSPVHGGEVEGASHGGTQHE